MPASGMLRRVALVRSNTVFLRRVLRLLLTANVPSSQILLTLTIEAIHSWETSVLTGATRLIVPEDGILLVVCLYM
jgi:hypothetical protein